MSTLLSELRSARLTAGETEGEGLGVGKGEGLACGVGLGDGETAGVGDGLGEYTVSTLWSQPLLSFSEFLSSISLGGEFQTKLMGIIIIFFGILGMWKLLSYFKK